MQNTPTMSYKMRLWLESPSGFKFGQGMAELLKRIEHYGSLRKAALSMGMSYRRAWGRLKRTEDDLGHALVYKPGGNKSGYKLTEVGENLLRGFEAWHESMERHAIRICKESFSETFKIIPHKAEPPLPDSDDLA